jgi:lipoprotein-anchoring transpeptidase ErfK/SrfK
LRRSRDAELAKPGGQLLARRRDAEIRALEASVGRRGAEAMGGTCPHCGLHSRRTRYCQACGHILPGERMRTVRSMSIPAAIAAVVLIAGAFLLGGIRTGRENTRRVDSAALAAQGFKNIVATARSQSIPIYLSKGDSSPLQTLPSPNDDGAPVVFLVRQRDGPWLEVALPTRPNGSTGWIRASDVTLTGHDYRMQIDLLSHRLTTWNGSKMIAQVPVGVGQAVTPTPSGQYYITELLRQPDPTGLYGPWAFGLSAHSDVLDEFAGADGILGIHGTNYPPGIGTDVSHGCIRMSNANITRLAHEVPVGTPVEITRT